MGTSFTNTLAAMTVLAGPLAAMTVLAGVGVAGAATAQAAGSVADVHAVSSSTVEQDNRVNPNRIKLKTTSSGQQWDRRVDSGQVPWYHNDFYYPDPYHGND